MTTPNFRRDTVPAPPPAMQLPDTGGLPLTKGVTLTPWTRNMLQGMGWKEGDPIPGEIGQRIQQVVKQVQTEQGGSPLPNAKPGERTKIGRQLKFEDLPADRQAELRQVMQQYQEEQRSPAAQQLRAMEAGMSTLAPGVQTAARQAALAAFSNQPQQAMPEVVLTRGTGPDFRRAAAQPVAPPTPPQNPEPPVETQPQPQENPETTQIMPDGPEEHPGNAGGLAPVTFCPRCLWNLSHAFEAKPTAEDRVAFIAAILGSRFIKAYPVMGNTVTLWFRGLLAAETDLIAKQMRYDALNQQILGEVDYFSRLNVYRLTCMLFKITDAKGAIIAEVPNVLDIPHDTIAGETVLVPLVNWFNEQVCATESLRRVASQHHREFQRLVEALEAQTGNPDFWSEIGQPR